MAKKGKHGLGLVIWVVQAVRCVESCRDWWVNDFLVFALNLSLRDELLPRSKKQLSSGIFCGRRAECSRGAQWVFQMGREAVEANIVGVRKKHAVALTSKDKPVPQKGGFIDQSKIT